MMKAITLACALAFGALNAFSAETQGAPHAEALGWRLGVQAFCFYKTDFFDMVDRLEAIGIEYLEAYPGQRVGGGFDGSFNETMPPETRAAVKKRLADANITLVNFGVAALTEDEAAARAVFEFGKDMGIETIVAEPPAGAMPMLDKLCAEYNIRLAIHNHPEPSPYWNPETVQAALNGCSERMGECVDTSHWIRSGIDVMQWLKNMEGRIVSFHFGDVQADKLAAFNELKAKQTEEGNPPGMIDHITAVPNAIYGQGPNDMMAWLRELHRQRFRGLFSVEAFFELTPDQTQANIAKCVEWFDHAAQTIAKE